MTRFRHGLPEDATRLILAHLLTPVQSKVLGLGMDDSTPTATTTTQKVSARSEKVGYRLVVYMKESLWLRAVFIFYFLALSEC